MICSSLRCCQFFKLQIPFLNFINPFGIVVNCGEWSLTSPLLHVLGKLFLTRHRFSNLKAWGGQKASKKLCKNVQIRHAWKWIWHQIKTNSYLDYRLVEVTKKYKKKFKKIPTYPLVKMTANRKQTYIFFWPYWERLFSSQPVAVSLTLVTSVFFATWTSVISASPRLLPCRKTWYTGRL